MRLKEKEIQFIVFSMRVSGRLCGLDRRRVVIDYNMYGGNVISMYCYSVVVLSIVEWYN